MFHSYRYLRRTQRSTPSSFLPISLNLLKRNSYPPVEKAITYQDQAMMNIRLFSVVLFF